MSTKNSSDTVACILCNSFISYCNGNTDIYFNHLKQQHKVHLNFSFILAVNFFDDNTKEDIIYEFGILEEKRINNTKIRSTMKEEIGSGDKVMEQGSKRARKEGIEVKDVKKDRKTVKLEKEPDEHKVSVIDLQGEINELMNNVAKKGGQNLDKFTSVPTVGKVFQCDHCEKSFLNKKNLDKHYQNHTQNDSTHVVEEKFDSVKNESVKKDPMCNKERKKDIFFKQSLKMADDFDTKFKDALIKKGVQINSQSGEPLLKDSIEKLVINLQTHIPYKNLTQDEESFNKINNSKISKSKEKPNRSKTSKPKTSKRSKNANILKASPAKSHEGDSEPLFKQIDASRIGCNKCDAVFPVSAMQFFYLHHNTQHKAYMAKARKQKDQKSNS